MAIMHDWCTIVHMLPGNTVGSLSAQQHAILVGSLLGDGTLRRQGTRTNALFEVNHSVAFREYVDWKYEHFQEYVLTPPHSRRGNGKRVAYRFTTRSLPPFTEYYERFYVNGRKQLPKELKLNPLILAVWFMDDGARSRSALYLNTQQFALHEQRLLQRLLKETFGIESNLNCDRHYRRIRITTASSVIFRKIIDPHILPCFRYKCIYDPVTTDPKGEGLCYEHRPRRRFLPPQNQIKVNDLRSMAG